VPERFDTISEQKREETKPTRPLTASASQLLVETPVRPALIFWHFGFNDPCVAMPSSMNNRHRKELELLGAEEEQPEGDGDGEEYVDQKRQ